MPTLVELIEQRKQAILDRWFSLVLETYPKETALLWKHQKSPFSNPVGNRIREGVDGILSSLLSSEYNESHDQAATFVDDIVRVRAVQDFRPSEAVAFIYLLKKVVREDLWADIVSHNLYAELLVLESKIDSLALLSLDIYAKCREKLYEMRIKETKNVQKRLLERAGMICGFSEEGLPAGGGEDIPN